MSADIPLHDFEAISGCTLEQRDRLAEWATRIEDTTEISAEAVAEASYYLAAAGYSPDETIACIGPMAAYADAVCADFVITVDQLTDCTAVFDIDVGDLPAVLDRAEETVREFPLTSEELFIPVQWVGPMARDRHYSLGEFFDSIGHCSRIGATGIDAADLLRSRLKNDRPLIGHID